jgi:hypothetical protein
MSALRRFVFRPLRWMIAIIVFLCWAIPIVWATLAIYYSNLPWAGMRLAMAATFAGFTIWAVWFSRRRSMSVIAMVLFLGVVAWWISIPSQLAPGGRGHAASGDRWRSRAPDRCAQL